MQLTRDQRVWQMKILFSTFVAYAGYYLVRKGWSSVKAPVQDEFGWTSTELANIWTGYLVAYMIGQFVSSFLGRKVGPRVLLLGGLALSMACNIVFGLADSYWTFLVFMIFNGFFQASGWPGVVGGVAHWLRPEQRGSIMGVWSCNYAIGNIWVKWAAGLVLGGGGTVYALYGYEFVRWRMVFFFLTAMTAIVWLLILYWQRDKPEDVGLDPIIKPYEEEKEAAVHAAMRERITLADYLRLAFSPLILIMGASYFCVKFLRYALDSWAPMFFSLQDVGHDYANYYASIFDIAGLAGAILAGIFLDKIFRGNWALLCMLLAIACLTSFYLVGAYGKTPFTIALLYGLVGFTLYGPDTIICGAAAVAVAGERNALAVAGIVNGIGSLGPVVQEQVIGYLIRNDTKQGMYDVNALFMALSALFVGLMAVQVLYFRHQSRKSGRAAA